jgi:sporulation protein YlmC with PRC-barrel domain
MANENTATLRKLSDTDQALADPAEDIRGRRVHDIADTEIGQVDELLVDSQEHRVRLLRIQHGGVLGIGSTTSFVPVEAITRVTDEVVYIKESGERVSQAPRYDPDLVDQDDLVPGTENSYYQQLYGYYGYPPFWGSGYVYP